MLGGGRLQEGKKEGKPKPGPKTFSSSIEKTLRELEEQKKREAAQRSMEYWQYASRNTRTPNHDSTGSLGLIGLEQDQSYNSEEARSQREKAAIEAELAERAFHTSSVGPTPTDHTRYYHPPFIYVPGIGPIQYEHYVEMVRKDAQSRGRAAEWYNNTNVTDYIPLLGDVIDAAIAGGVSSNTYGLSPAQKRQVEDAQSKANANTAANVAAGIVLGGAGARVPTSVAKSAAKQIASVAASKVIERMAKNGNKGTGTTH